MPLRQEVSESASFKVHLTIIAAEDQVTRIVDPIVEGARTGQIGDGKIFVTSLDDLVRM